MKLDEFTSSDTRAFFCLLLKPHPPKKRKFHKKEEKVPKFSVPDIRGISFLFFWKNLVQEYRLLRFFDLLLNVGQKIIESDFATVQMNVRKPSETHYMLENK